MKKFTAILLTVLMVASLFISCENNIVKGNDETVSVKFEQVASKSLTASLAEFKADNYYWAYKATKKDGTGLISGQIDFAWISKGEKGLSKKVPGFSQGTWEFTLYAYTEEGKNNSRFSETGLAYQGTNPSVTLTKESSNKVVVSVSPLSKGKGTLIVDTANISLKTTSTLDDAQLALFEKQIEVTDLTGGTKYYPVEGNYSLEAGAYKVNVTMYNTESKVAYPGSVVATVYANMTTTVTGTVEEILTNAEFDTFVNPDVMNRKVTSEPFDNNAQAPINLDSDATHKVKAIVPNTVAKKLLNDAAVANGVQDAENSMTLTLSVDTTKTGVTNDGKSTISYEIGLSSVLTSISSDNTVTQYAVPVSGPLDESVVAEIKLQKGLSGVSVTHNGNIMKELENAEVNPTDADEYGGFFYNQATGLLTIKTKSFSPFEVTYETPAYVAEVGDKKFARLEDAFNSIPQDGIATITLLSDAVVTENIIICSGENITLDLNGKNIDFASYYVTNDKGEQLLQNYFFFMRSDKDYEGGTLNIIGSGTISAPANVVFQVWSLDNVESEEEEVPCHIIIGKDVIVDCAGAYAIAIFEGDTNIAYDITVDIYGTVQGEEPIYVSGNIKNTNRAPNINIHENAKVICKGESCVYLAGFANTTIAKGAEITSENANAISIAAGNLTVEGGTITGGNSYSFDEGGGGSIEFDNASAIYVKQHTTNLPVNVVVNGGKFSAYLPFYQAKGQSANPRPDLVTLEINGGEFISTATTGEKVAVKSDDKTDFIHGGAFSDLVSPLKYAADGATITLGCDADGGGLETKDQEKAQFRNALTIDLAGHTYTMVKDPVGSEGYETQAMHWGQSVGSVTMKNGSFIASGSAAKMAMQNHTNFTAENMNFDFSDLQVDVYTNGVTSTGKPINYGEYANHEIPLFNNNKKEMLLDNCNIVMPIESTKGLCAGGTNVILKNTTIDGYVSLEENTSKVTVVGNTTTKGIVPYFENRTVDNKNDGNSIIYTLAPIQ